MNSHRIHYLPLKSAQTVFLTVAFLNRLHFLYTRQLLYLYHSVYPARQQRFADHRADSDKYFKVLRDLLVATLSEIVALDSFHCLLAQTFALNKLSNNL